MHKPRRHERVPLIAELTIEPGDDRPARFASRMFNVSAGGAGVFATRAFPVGKLVGMKLHLPTAGPADQAVMLCGVIRRLEVRDDGNVLGIEFVPGAADHDRFVRYLDTRRAGRKRTPAGGFTLVECCIAMVVLCLMVTLALPFYTRAAEQAKLDAAAVNLKSVWSAQRVYWLEYHCFAIDLATLESMDLVSTMLARTQGSPTAAYVYVIDQADGESFSAAALRNGSGVWTGQLRISETGEITGQVTGPDGHTLSPPS